jgi:CMP-N,N'-diacetyllegionaminic acid synthase
MRAVAVVPARGGSERVPNKNLARLGGVTLVRRALERALESSAFELVVLSSDDDEILAEAAGLDVMPLRRPAELATATARAYDVVVHALDEVDRDGVRFDVVAVVQCTSPLTASEDLVGAMDLLERAGAESVVTVCRVVGPPHPSKLKRLVGDRLLPYLEDDELRPSHQLPELWARNGSLYASRVDVIRGGRLVGGDVRGYEMPLERSVDIDTPLDLAFAEFLLGRR